MTATVIDPVHALVVRGRELAGVGQFRSAIGAYSAALDLLAAGKRGRASTLPILTALGDAAFRAGLYGLVVSSLEEVVRFGDLCEPLVYLRLGQAHFELGRPGAAADQLFRAHALGRGDAEFEGQDPKYLALLRARALR